MSAVRPITGLSRAAALLIAGLLAACAPPKREAVESLTLLGKDEVIVVGRVELVPGLAKDEQVAKGVWSGIVRDKMFILTSDEKRVLEAEPRYGDFRGRIDATLTENFFVRSRNRPFYITGGMLYVGYDERNFEQYAPVDQDKAYFPGGFKVAIAPGDKAIYIGTLQYHRDEFFQIKKVAIVDDYKRANEEFRKRFGATHTLRKSLLTVAR